MKKRNPLDPAKRAKNPPPAAAVPPATFFVQWCPITNQLGVSSTRYSELDRMCGACTDAHPIQLLVVATTRSGTLRNGALNFPGRGSLERAITLAREEPSVFLGSFAKYASEERAAVESRAAKLDRYGTSRSSAAAERTRSPRRS